jgi:hypothetical protein
MTLLENRILDQIKELKTSISSKTYASALILSETPAKIGQKSRKSNNNTIVVKSKITSNNCFQNKKSIEKSLKSAKKSFDINRVKHISNGGLVIDCETT